MEHSVASEITVFENMLRPLTPHFEQALAGAMPVARLMRSIMISVERNPKLLAANRQSLLNAAMSAACLGLEVDGVTGQAFFIPFAGKAQLVIGYKGMNTLAARSGFTVQGEVVREGDEFDYELGDKGYVRHKPLLGNTGKIIGAWATASAQNRPSIISVMGIDDIMKVKNKAPGGSKSDSPWNDPMIGFPAMASKTVKRRLARSMPLNIMQVAAAMEEGFEERGKATWIDPDHGLQIEGEAIQNHPQINHDQRGTVELLAPRTAPAPVQHAGADDYGADDLMAWDSKLATAALQGTDSLREMWGTVPKHLKKSLEAALRNRHQPAAESVTA
jgi:phage RecT family recombinase